MAQLQYPAFLASYDDLAAHLSEHFESLQNVTKGTKFATFAARLVSFVPDLREFGEVRLSERQSHDGGIDIISEPLEDGRQLLMQAK